MTYNFVTTVSAHLSDLIADVLQNDESVVLFLLSLSSPAGAQGLL